MDIIGQHDLHEAINSLQNHSEYQKILGVLLKYEIQMLLQRLAATGEESVVMTIKMTDGTFSVIGSDFGEKFVQCSEGDVITDFKEQFVRYCHTGTCLPGTESETDPHKEDDENCTETVHESVHESVHPIHMSASSCHVPDGASVRKKMANKADQTVSDLVKNIMKQAREEELGKHNIWVKDSSHDEDISVQSSSLPKYFQHYSKVRQSNILSASFPGHRVMGEFDEENKAIEDTVSQLVRNIKAQAEIKEKQKLSTSRQRRKRSLQVDADGSVNPKIRRHSGRGRRPKSIASCFPAISHSSDNSLNGITDVHTVIKVEPADNGYDEIIVNRINGEYSEEQETSVSGGLECWSEERPDSQQDDTGSLRDIGGPQSKPRKLHHYSLEENNGEVSESLTVDSTCASDEDTGLRIVDTYSGAEVKLESNSAFDDDIELPFVEEYYEKRGEPFEQPTLNQSDYSEKKDDVHERPNLNQSDYSTKNKDTCYVASPRKPGKFNLMHHGYCYIKDKEGKNNTIYWKCGRFQCKGRVIQRDGENMRTQDHNHSPTLQLETNKDEETSNG